MEEDKKINKTFGESEFLDYLGKVVRIMLFNGYSYSGKVIDISENNIKIIDKFSQEVTLSNKGIMSIMEVSR